MEKDDEVKGSGNSYDFIARMYDARIGRWLSRDPREKDYVPFSPYIISLNSTLILRDADGKVVVDGNGKPVTVSVTKAKNGTATATYEFAEGTTDEVKAQFMANGGDIINDMLITKVGQEQVDHLINTKSKVTMNISEDIGIASYTKEDGKTIYGVIYGISGPNNEQSSKLIKDYDGGKVYEETTITLYKGSLKYGMGDKTALEAGNVTLQNLNTGEVTRPGEFTGELQPSQYPDMLYKNEFQLNNLGGTHEVEHTKSENIKTARAGDDTEEGPIQKEKESRADPNFDKN
jgi:hypothetical protein